MHWFIGGTGISLLLLHYGIEQNEIFNAFGWVGLVLGVVLWWHNEKHVIEQITAQKNNSGEK
ncbi:hypothetical protein GOZ71_06300 [Vibrio parahaemolyticus]|nr:hypothetical protein [Vibrio parahaemolyticus]